MFGEEISVNLMFLKGKAVLHVVNTATRFLEAILLDAHGSTYGQAAEDVWIALKKYWCTIYTGYPNRWGSDQGLVFTSKRWTELSHNTKIEIRLQGFALITCFALVNIYINYWKVLRKNFYKVEHDFSTVNDNTLLRIALEAVSYTIGRNKIFSSRPGFEVVFRNFIKPMNLLWFRRILPVFFGWQIKRGGTKKDTYKFCWCTQIGWNKCLLSFLCWSVQ